MIDSAAPEPAPGTPNYRLARTIVLVGLMGAGKTSVGKRVAARLAVPFTDSDSEIEAAAGMTIPEIFANFGEPDFRDGERRVIARLLTEVPRVLATGGGAFIEPRTREAIAEGGVSVWIRAEVEVLWARVRGKPGRPLLEAPDPRGRLEELDRLRSPVYAQADITVDSTREASHEVMAQRIIDAVLEHDRLHPERPPTLEIVTP
ncbi:shikimate kinase [Rhodobacteraceae bacterium DSL-40]|uniref:shikimate kinase n=1 Tax=Amaricoccus sp. B4 TaxID=3368557 RepID=UPI000DAF0891